MTMLKNLIEHTERVDANKAVQQFLADVRSIFLLEPFADYFESKLMLY